MRPKPTKRYGSHSERRDYNTYRPRQRSFDKGQQPFCFKYMLNYMFDFDLNLLVKNCKYCCHS